jgi:hypothetical protein
LSIETARSRVNEYSVDEQGKTVRGNLTKTVLVFLLSFFVLFIGMSLRPNLYDEGLILTGAMRVAAGQVPHRDFYTNYGPGQFYAIAGLFKLFGESLLVERLYDLFIKALLVAFSYEIVSSYCRRSIAVWTSVATVLWLLGLNQMAGAAVIPVSLLNLVASILLLPILLRPVSIRRMFAAGVVAGMAALFRYDTGVALLGIHACVIAIAVSHRMSRTSNRLRTFASTFWSYLLGFAAVTLPGLFYYLSVSPLYPFVHDIIIYPSKYYHRGRNLPFPEITLSGLENIGIYLPIAIVGISLYIVVIHGLADSRKGASNSQSIPDEHRWHAFLLMFGLLALAMYFKGFVRVSLVHMYLSITPSLLLVAVLFQHKMTLSRPIRTSVTFLMWFSVLASGLCALREVSTLQHVEHTSVPKSILLSARHALPKIQAAWCQIESPLTRGFCFLPDDDRIQTIEFIASHTRPDQKLFVGQAKHDRVVANDNLIYFATLRLPATKWSQFDPDLVNRYDIQKQIIDDLEATAPPYIVLDPEFDLTHEPNDSSKSSGVTLLDEYIHNKYQHVETFGEMSIFQRIQTP